MEAGKRRLASDTARAATTDEVKDLRREASALKECVADLTLENRLLKKHMALPVCKGILRCQAPHPTRWADINRNGGRDHPGIRNLGGLRQ